VATAETRGREAGRMPFPEQPRSAVQDLVLARDASTEGLTAAVRSATKSGALARIRRGSYLDAKTLEGLGATERYKITIAAVMASRKQPIATGMSAAALLDLPIVGKWPHEVFLLSHTYSSRKRRGVVEVASHGTEGLIERDGYILTDIPDTLIQVCRNAPFVTALSMVDAALRVDRFGRRPPMTTVEKLLACHYELLPYSGSIRVSQILGMASTQAESTLETISRVVIDELGFPEPQLQYRLYLPVSEREIFMDFGWPKYRVGGEADGRGKYLGNDSESVSDPVAKIINEKRRDNEIRGQKWTPAHWEWSDALNRSLLRRILLEAGLPIVRRTRRYL
jgi:hypothetical protein